MAARDRVLLADMPSSGPELIIRPSPVSATPVATGSSVGTSKSSSVAPSGMTGIAPGDGCVRVDDDLHRQVERAREVEVALVVRGHGHDGAVAVVGEHVVGGPDRAAARR